MRSQNYNFSPRNNSLTNDHRKNFNEKYKSCINANSLTFYYDIFVVNNSYLRKMQQKSVKNEIC